MAVTLKQTEAMPDGWPEINAPYVAELNGTPLAIPAYKRDSIWQRIESYIAHRFVPREVVWLVEGDGDWEPPLTPTVLDVAAAWRLDQWQSVNLRPSPYGGYRLPECGLYRITATVGGGDVPPAVGAAAERLLEYALSGLSEAGPQVWATDVAVKDADQFESKSAGSTSFSRPAAWMAKSLISSGAADLLRPYRRV